MNRRFVAAVLVLFASARPLAAQRALTLDDAVRLALADNPAAVLARADSADGAARLAGARAHPDPLLATDYTRDPPRLHAEFELPLDVLGGRASRIDAAEASFGATRLAGAAARARIRYDVTVAYVEAAAARRRLDLAARAAEDAAELERIARARRDAGDASDLDVAVAGLAAGAERNRLARDSLAAVSAMLDLQLLIGESATAVTLVVADSLESLVPGVPAQAATPLRVAFAQSILDSRNADLAWQHRLRFPAPALRFGVEASDPDTPGSALLPTVGLTFALPLFDRNRSGIALASSGVARATAELRIARRESAAAVARARRRMESARRRFGLDNELVTDAERVAGLVTAAYREGAYALGTVIDAQRTVREALTAWVDDIAELIIAGAALTLETTGAGQ